MHGIHIDLAWWAPGPGDPIGEERTLERVDRLREVAGPIIAEAEEDLRARSRPGARLGGGGTPARDIARFRFDTPQVQTLCVGSVYQVGVSDPGSNSISLDRDGVLSWRRD